MYIILLVTGVSNWRHSDANSYCLLSLTLLQSTNIDVISRSDAGSRDQKMIYIYYNEFTL